MKKQKDKKQPLPKKGSSFTSWAVYNWGICYQRSFRTRKEAHEYCWKGSHYFRKGKRYDAKCWNDVKDHMHVAKVKSTVL